MTSSWGAEKEKTGHCLAGGEPQVAGPQDLESERVGDRGDGPSALLFNLSQHGTRPASCLPG